MKKKSVIILIIAAALIVTGAAMCLVSNAVARNNGVDIFYQNTDEEGNAEETREFSSNSVSKIALDLTDADVYVTGGAEKSELVFKNFAVGTYSIVTTNRVLSFDDNASFFSLFDITKSGFSFSGFRQYLNLDRFAGKDRTVHIYLSDGNVKQYDFRIRNGSVHFENIDFEADISLEVENGDVIMDCGKISSANIGISGGSLTLKADMFDGSLDADVKGGNAKIITPNKTTRDYLLTATGRVMIFGVEYPSPYKVESPVLEGKTSFEVSVDGGNIDLESPITEITQETVFEG